MQGQWAILNEQGQNAVTFTSFIDIDVRDEGQALSYPVEQGSFANYNKVDDGIETRVTLGLQGSESDFESALNTLSKLRKAPEKVIVTTPATVYSSMTLEAFNYKRTVENGAGMLVVELVLKEVEEVETQTTTTRIITKPKNPTSASNKNTGQTQPHKSLFNSAAGRVV